VAVVEPEALAKQHDVTLLTFCGIINNGQAKVNHVKVISNGDWLQPIRNIAITRWFLMVFETLFTLAKAVYLYKKGKYDIIHLRDGEPFFFLPFIVSLPFKNIRWFISLTAAIINNVEIKKRSLLSLIYVNAIKLINNDLWRFVFKRSMKHNHFTIAPQNENTGNAYKKYMRGIFANHVKVIPWGIDSEHIKIDKVVARDQLKLPQDRFILLSFGAPHPGKSMETVFKGHANAFIVLAGTHVYSLGDNPVELAKRYCPDDSKIFDYFIPEADKPLFFGCADAVILSYTKAFVSESSMLWESCKYDLPVIASDANLLGKDVKQYNLGVTFEAENAESLRRAIHYFHVYDLNQFALGRKQFITDHSRDLWLTRCSEAYL
jgi:glycosyltransferase involved in cell wall biosynthesis